MNKHTLSLEVPHTNNTKVFRVLDTSQYATDAVVSNSILQIIPPGYNQPVDIEVLPGFNLVLNGCTLGLSTGPNCTGNLVSIPDGIYILKYTIDPAAEFFVEYSYLRVSQTLNKYYNELARLEIAACDHAPDVSLRLNELTKIRTYIDAAKAKVEYGHDPAQGMELLLYAQKRLTAYTTIHC